MRRIFTVLAAAVLLPSLSSCASWLAPPVQPGQTEAEVIAKLGRPTNVYQDGASRALEYMHGPMGQTTEMARIGPDGKLVSFEQVLNMRTFSTITVGEADKNKVLRTVGTPSQIQYFRLSKLEAWNYPYRENGIWDSMMTVYFDKSGIVRKMENGPDPNRLPGGDAMK